MIQSRLQPDRARTEDAHRRIAGYIHRTPLLTSRNLNNLLDAELWFKCENLQKAGAFKSRGACNAVFSLGETEASRGVCTHSSGNHAQALARAAGLRNISAHIVMPSNAPAVKVAAVKHYGGNITFCEPTLQARETTLAEIRKATGAVEIHPYNHPDVIFGQSTCAKEVFEDLDSPPDIIITPVGGGGLLSGTCLSARIYSPDTLVMAAEPEGANDAYRSFTSGELIPSVQPNTIADGLLTSLGSLTWPVIRDEVSAIHTVSDELIVQAMKLLMERMKLVVEPSAAVTLAALLKMQQSPEGSPFKGKKMVLVLSGGNVDVSRLPF